VRVEGSFHANVRKRGKNAKHGDGAFSPFGAARAIGCLGPPRLRVAVTLRPIPGAPVDAPIPDFPAGEPTPLLVPDSRFARRPLPAPEPPSVSPPARRPGPVEIRDNRDGVITFRCTRELPAIHRASMTISVTGETAGACRLDLAAEEARAFLLALRDGGSPVVAFDGGSGCQIEFAMTEDGPGFSVGKSGQTRRFSPGPGFDVTAMAEQLLAELGP
jgi:hypothetical protein